MVYDRKIFLKEFSKQKKETSTYGNTYKTLFESENQW